MFHVCYVSVIAHVNCWRVVYIYVTSARYLASEFNIWFLRQKNRSHCLTDGCCVNCVGPALHNMAAVHKHACLNSYFDS